MSSPKLAIGLAVLFCSFVAILMIILYYPKDAIEEEFDTPKHLSPDPNNAFDPIADEEPKNSMKDIERHRDSVALAF
ncbi:hypothetical protein JTE90_017999 [Oedothorax gibbosus]|uniref:Uncharacterized protein n=1 Tax=Oedothorax gibbosus TaxID=931172 RepID=A0AAV6V953_9ARAC|nr:hypothetical protein JTE90_017999 [Oedothorax gibbosus]